MLIWNPSKLTEAGKALLAQAQAGKTAIHITKAQTGSGSYSGSESLEKMTALKAPKQTFPISNKEISATNTLILKIAITNKGSDFELESGYEIKEFGIFAKSNDGGEVLYSIATANTSDYMPAYNGIIPSVINMKYYLEVANAENVTINSSGAFALQEDLEALEERVTKVEQYRSKKYGVRRKTSLSSTSAWERIGDSEGLVAGAAVGSETVRNDFMASVYPYNKAIPCNLSESGDVTAYMGDANFQWDGSNGDVMLELPIFYSDRYFEEDEDGVEWEYRWISAGPVDGLHIHPLFIDGDVIKQKAYLPIFNGSFSDDETKLESKAGVYPLHNKTRAQFRELCTAKGSDWSLDDVWGMHALDQLYLVMFANGNAQSVIGKGLSEMPYSKADGMALQAREGVNYITVKDTYAAKFKVGDGIGIGTDVGSYSVCIDRTITEIVPSTEVGSASCVHFDGDPVNITTDHCLWSCVQKTGATIDMMEANGRCEGVDGRTHMRFLYIEDWYGNGWQFRDGDNIDHWQHYYCMKRSSYADKKLDGDYFKVGYEAAQTDGYVKKFGYDREHPEIEICIDASGSSSTYFSDYYHQAEGGEVVISGGLVGYGTAAGPFYRYCSPSASHSNWSFVGRPQYRK